MREGLLAAVRSGSAEKTLAEIRKIWFFKHSTLNECWGDHSTGATLGSIFGEGLGQTHYTLLAEAVARGHDKVVDVLLQEGAEIAQGFPGHGNYALIAAVRGGSVEVAKVLLKYKANVKEADYSNWTCLHEAANRGRADFVSLFLEHNADPRIIAHDDLTPQKLALRGGHRDVAEILQRAEAVARATRPPLRPKGAFSEAIKRGKLEDVEIFLKLGDKPNTTCLFDALDSGNLKMAEILLKFHPEVITALDTFAIKTCLHEAARQGKADFVNLFLKHGADPRVTVLDGMTAQSIALRHGYREVAEILKHAEAALPPLPPKGTLQSAIRNGRIKDVEFFLKTGATPSPSWLFDAIEGDSVEIARLLIRAGAMLNASKKDKNQWTCLHEAAMRDKSNFVTLFIEHGADPTIEAEGYNHLTARAIAIREGHRAIAAKLLEAEEKKGGELSGASQAWQFFPKSSIDTLSHTVTQDEPLDKSRQGLGYH